MLLHEERAQCRVSVRPGDAAGAGAGLETSLWNSGMRVQIEGMQQELRCGKATGVAGAESVSGA
jgi:hypothetical protein